MKRIIALGSLLAILLTAVGGCSLNRERSPGSGWYDGTGGYYRYCPGRFCPSGGGFSRPGHSSGEVDD